MSKVTPEQEKGAHGTLPTVKIVAEKTEDNPNGYIVINESDFDPDEHELHADTKKEQAEAAKAAKPHAKSRRGTKKEE